MKQIRVALLLLVLVACKRGNPEEFAVSGPEPPPAAAVVRGGATLDSTLVALEIEVNAALSPDGDVNEAMTRAEAITDRLLETQPPFAWLKTRAYGVDPMLRQIQSLADRIQAQLRTAVPLDVVREDIRRMQQKVRGLRAALLEGGGPAPMLLDSLLAAYEADSLLKIIERGGE